MKVLSPKYDIIFKSVFTDPETPEVLKGFLAESLGVEYDSIDNIEIGNSEIHAESEDEKFSRLDLLADVDGRKVNIEIQCTKQIDFADRSLYYWAKTFGAQLKSGMPYGRLPQVICINIVDFKLFKEHEDYASTFEIYDTKHKLRLSDKFKTIYFELPKALERESKLENTGLDAWMRFFNADSEEDLTMLERTTNEPIKKAVLTLRKLSKDEIMQEKIRLEEKRRHDEASFLYTAREEGINIGIGKSFMLMVKNGIDPKKAASLLDYSVADFKDELYCLQDTLKGFKAEDYL